MFTAPLTALAGDAAWICVAPVLWTFAPVTTVIVPPEFGPVEGCATGTPEKLGADCDSDAGTAASMKLMPRFASPYKSLGESVASSRLGTLAAETSANRVTKCRL